MLVIRAFERKLEIARLDKAVGRKSSASSVVKKLMKELESVLKHIHAEPLQGEALGDVMKVDPPRTPCLFQAMVDGINVIVVEVVVDVSI